MRSVYAEVCSGAGGLSLGAIRAGVRVLFLNELETVPRATLVKNHAGIRIVEGSFTDIDFLAHRGQIDILAGGVPCQSFSQAGERRGLEDARGGLVMAFARAVKDARPKVFVLENVKGLLTHEKGSTFSEILRVLSEGYTVYHRLLDASYHGVPQKRERVFVVGIRSDVHHGAFVFPAPSETRTTLRVALTNVPPSPGVSYPEHKRVVMEMVPPGGCWVDLPEPIRTEYMGGSLASGGGKRGIARRLSYDEPCLTLTTSPSQKQTERCHPTETRPLTVREYARVQSFPDDYEFVGSVSSQYKQIGNAVPPRLAEEVICAIVAYLDAANLLRDCLDQVKPKMTPEK